MRGGGKEWPTVEKNERNDRKERRERVRKFPCIMIPVLCVCPEQISGSLPLARWH